MDTWPPEMSVREALAAYLQENGFTVASYTEPTAEVSFLDVAFNIPNPKSRNRAVALHDLHHVACGFGTDPAGEAEVSVFEVATGLATTGLYVGSIIVAVAMFGGVIAPLRSWRALGRNQPPRRNLFGADKPYAELMGLSVGELRAYMGLPARGIASTKRGLHSKAPPPS